MTVKHRLWTVSLLPLALAVAVGAVYLTATRQQERLQQRAELARELMKGASELALLSYEHAQHQSERAADQWRHRYSSLTARYRDLVESDASDPVLTDLRPTLSALPELFEELFAARDNPVLEQRLTNQLLTRVNNLTPLAARLSANSAEQVAAVVKRTRFLVMALSFTAAVAVATVSVIVARSVLAPLARLQQAMGRVGAGSLEVGLPASGDHDEIASLITSFGKMTVRLREQSDSLRGSLGTLRTQAGEVTQAASTLGSAASDILAEATHLASSAAETSVAVTETTTTIEEIRVTAGEASDNARSVAETAQAAARVSESGRASTELAVAGVEKLRGEMQSLAERLARLSEQSAAIGEIIFNVEDLAHQSNLLAINASIEAAKAGERGRSFAVVAQEVKRLAKQSQEFTARITGILTEIHQAVADSAAATAQGAKTVEAVAQQAEEAGHSIVDLAGRISEGARAATQIAASSKQQVKGIEQVVEAMENIRHASEQNSDGARQLATAARRLHELGRGLTQVARRSENGSS